MRVLIIGAGIAGTFLAREFHQRGVSVVVVDDADFPSASRAAAGLVSPIFGLRLTLIPHVEDLMETARAAFTTWGEILGHPVWHPLPIDRIFRDEGERERWDKRIADPAYRHWSASLPEDFGPFPHGGMRITGGGWFDYRCLPEILVKEGVACVGGRMDPAALAVREKGVEWEGSFFDAAFFCRGYVTDDPWFTGLPWKAARGDILTVRASAGPVDSIWTRGIFVVPLGGGVFRVGSTYRWSGFGEGPTQESREALLEGWRALHLPEAEVLDHRVGVRPILQDRLPVLGRHPRHPALWIGNGLGSRGAMLAPTMARQLADALLKGTPVDAEWDVARFFRGT